MASDTRYARPNDNVSPNATWTVQSGSAAASGYPASNVGNRNPAKPFKSVGTSTTLRATFGSNQVLVAVAIINHNLAGASSVVLTSGAGLNQTVTIPANDSDGQCLNPFLDFSSAALAQRTSTTFDLAITTNALGNVAIGEILLLTALRDLRWMWGLKFQPGRAVVRHRTFGGSLLAYDKKIRVRRASGRVQLQSEETAMRLLETEGRGEVYPWLLIPVRTVNDCWFVQFVPGSFAYMPRSLGSTELVIEAEEVSSGPPLF